MTSRLIKKASLIKYEITSPIEISLIADEEVDRGPLKGFGQYLDSLIIALKNNNIKANNLRCPFSDIIKSAEVTVGDDYNSHTFIEVERELTQSEIETLENAVLGQFSDGWGEGFEQREIEHYKDQFDEEYEDEETGEKVKEKSTQRVDVFAHFFTDKNFYMNTKKI